MPACCDALEAFASTQLFGRTLFLARRRRPCSVSSGGSLPRGNDHMNPRKLLLTLLDRYPSENERRKKLL